MALPPIQPVDHTPIVVLPQDGAWDHDRFNYEAAVLQGKREPDERGRPDCTWAAHPLNRYFGGETRWHISPEVEQYLDRAAGPVLFRLERLPWAAWCRVREAEAQGRMHEARLLALRYGLASIEGLELDVRAGGAKMMTEAELLALRRRVGDGALNTLGAASINVSRELLDTEKKP